MERFLCKAILSDKVESIIPIHGKISLTLWFPNFLKISAFASLGLITPFLILSGYSNFIFKKICWYK